MSSNIRIASLFVLTALVYLIRDNFKSPALKTSQNAITYLNNQQIVDSICASAAAEDYYSSYEHQASENILSFLNSFQSSNVLYEYAIGQNKNQDFSDFAEEYGKDLAPYASVGIIMLISTLISCCFYCCNCRCCKCCIGEASPAKRRFCAFFGFFLLVAMGIIAVTAFIFALNYLDDFEDAACSGATFLGTVSYGNLNQKWVGLDPAIATLNQINSNISSTINLLPDISNAHKKLDQNYDDTETQINDLYTNFQNAMVSDPKSNDSTIMPTYIANLGPPSADDTVTYYLQYELDVKFNTTVEALSQVNQSIQSLRSQVSSIQSNLQNGIYQAQNFSSNVSEILYTYGNTTEQIQKYQSYFSITLIIYFGIFAVISIIVAIAFFFVIFMGRECLPRLTKVAWGVLLSMITVIFIFGSFAFPILMFSQNACAVADDALNNNTIFNQILQHFLDDETIEENMEICLFGNGDILSQFGIQQYLSEFADVSNSVDLINSTFNASTPPSVVIPAQINLINQFISGAYPVNETVLIELANLNSFTNYKDPKSSQKCDATIDTWVLNDVNCTESDGFVFPTDGDPSLELSRPVCLGLNAYTDNPFDRYSDGVYLGCGTTNTEPFNVYVSNYVAGFQKHMSSVADLFGQINQNLTAINSTDETFLNECLSLISPILEVNTNFSYILNAVSNNQTGLYPNFNCGFLKDNGNNLIQNLCGNYLSNFFVTCLLALVLGIVTWIAVLPIFCITRILKEKEKPEKKVLIENAYDPIDHYDYEYRKT